MVQFKTKEMGKIKEHFLNNMPEEEYFPAASFHNEWMQYEEWRNSDAFIDIVNDELNQSRPIYSQIDVDESILYAIDGISVDPSEVGKDVYGKLFHEKVGEYLTSQR
jgi:hypothetical protein